MTKANHPPGPSPISNPGRRRFLLASTSLLGGAGISGVAMPFVLSWSPSDRALAAGAPIDVNISKIEPGQLVTVLWRSRPVWILRRTDEMLDQLPELHPQLADPASKAPQQFSTALQTPWRSIKREYFVCVAFCTHLGCVPSYEPDTQVQSNRDGQGGFFCPCHGSRFDLAGRVFKEQPAPLNLPVMPHYYVSDSVLRIGELEDGQGRNWQPVAW